jgi:hypothetical protein
MFDPAVTGLGTPLLVTLRSQSTAMVVVVVVVLVLTELLADRVDVAVVVPAATLGATLTTTIMLADAPDARLGSVQVTFPVAPTAGVTQVQPAGAMTDSNVVFVGVASVKFATVAAAGPLLVTVWV